VSLAVRRAMMMSALVLLLFVAGSAQNAVSDSDQNYGGIQWVPHVRSDALEQKHGNVDSVWTLSGDSASAQPSTLTHASPGVPSLRPGRSTALPALVDLQLSHDSMEVVRGLVEAFIHKVELMPGEKRCLENNTVAFANDIMGTVEDVVTASKAMVAGKGTNGTIAKHHGTIVKHHGAGIMAAGIDGATKLMSLLTLSTTILKNCVHGDALELMKKTGQDMMNGTYLEHRILVNGVDIAQSLSDSILAFEAQDFYRFGTDIGIALRKILLSKATNGTTPLPEGVPEQVIIQQATQGLMDGFFTRGSTLEITDSASYDVDIVVNLHQCIAGNSEFFKEIWMASWELFAQMSVNKEQHGLGFQQNETAQPKWQGELVFAMMQMPLALSKCGVTEDMQRMLTEAIKSLQSLNVRVGIPHHQITGKEATEMMAKAVQAWTHWDFERFGFELGTLFRELVMLAFPEKYSVDASGRLHLLGPSSPAQVTSSKFIAGGIVASFAAALVVV